MPDMPEESVRGALSILHLCAPAHVGGLERVVQGLARGQATLGHRVAVAAVVQPDADPSAFLTPLRDAGVECVLIRVSGRAYVTELRKVVKLLSSWGPDILHTHGYRSDLLHGDVARAKGIATVTTLHGSSRMGGLSHLFEWIQEGALKRFDAVIAVSEPLERSLLERGVRPERIHDIPNAWTPSADSLPRHDARQELGMSDRELRIGWVGRLIPIKGCDVFVEALSHLPRDRWCASVVGDGPERSRLEALAIDLSIEERVDFMGVVPDAARFFSAFDVLVLSSRSEGTPMVVLEAMGMGVPVVATAVGGVEDLLRDGLNGWLVPPEDPVRLARAIWAALDDPGERAARARRAHELVRERYAFDSWIERHVDAYRSALEVRQG